MEWHCLFSFIVPAGLFQADLVALQKLNPQLAKELEEVIKTGKEENRFYGLSSKLKG